MSEIPYALAAALADESSSRTTEMLGFFFIALLIFGPLAFLLYFRHRRQTASDVIIDLREPPPDEPPEDTVLGSTVDEVLDEIDRIARDLRVGRLPRGESIEVFVAHSITIEGRPVDESTAMTIILDTSHSLGLTFDGSAPAEGGSVLRFRLQQPTA